MNKLGAICLFVSAVLSVVSCNDINDDFRPEPVVQETFDAKFPTATNLSWSMSSGFWLADFILANRYVSAWFEEDGTWLLTKTEFLPTSIPERLKTAINESKYKEWQLDDVDHVDAKGLITTYIVEAHKEDKEMNLYFSVEEDDIKFLTAITDEVGNNFPRPIDDLDKITDAIELKHSDIKLFRAVRDGLFVYAGFICNEDVIGEITFDKDYKWLQSILTSNWESLSEEVIEAFERAEKTFNPETDSIRKILLPGNTTDLIVYYFITINEEGIIDDFYFTDAGEFWTPNRY